MQPFVTCYFEKAKPKSQRVLEAFAAGARVHGQHARLVHTGVPELAGDGPVAFYGVRPPWRHLWRQATAEGRQRFYLDNSFLDAGRETHFRVGVNALQSWSEKPSDGKRLAALGVKVQPWRKDGRHIVVCRQSDEFISTFGRWPGDSALAWQQDVLDALNRHTDRPIVVRVKSEERPLVADLTDAWLLVTHSSAAAVEALIAGVPVIVTDAKCAAWRFSSTFKRPRMDDGREEWAARLADSQWTLNELRAGLAWRAIHEEQAA